MCKEKKLLKDLLEDHSVKKESEKLSFHENFRDLVELKKMGQ